MPMSAVEELEKSATLYACEAVKLDKQGMRKMAIVTYQRAIETLLKLVQFYPEYDLNKVYMQRAMTYKARIKILQGAWPAAPQPTEERVEAKPFAETGETREVVYGDLVLQQKPNVKWEEVIGLEDAKRAIKEAIVYPSQRPDLFPLGWPKGILLFGPPGCGKTLLAATVATEINATFISVDAASIMSKWLGEGEQNVARLFNSAREPALKGNPAIIFIDELDSLIGVHSNEVGGETRVRNQFLKEMDGIVDKGKNIPLYVIGSTNKPWSLDSPFIRRFQKRIYIPLPDYNARLKMFELYAKHLNLEFNVDLRELAMLTEGFSGSDIRDVCQSAQLKVNRELFESGRANNKQSQPRPISISDFREVLEERKPSVSPETLPLYNKWFEVFKAL